VAVTGSDALSVLAGASALVSHTMTASCVFSVSNSNPLVRTANARQCRRTGMSSNPYVSSTCVLSIHRDVLKKLNIPSIFGQGCFVANSGYHQGSSYSISSYFASGVSSNRANGGQSKVHRLLWIPVKILLSNQVSQCRILHFGLPFATPFAQLRPTYKQ
jgi:hypothetical protein